MVCLLLVNVFILDFEIHSRVFYASWTWKKLMIKLIRISFLACYDVWVLVTNGLDGLRGVPSSWFSIIINGVGVLSNSKWSTTR